MANTRGSCFGSWFDGVIFKFFLYVGFFVGSVIGWIFRDVLYLVGILVFGVWGFFGAVSCGLA